MTARTKQRDKKESKTTSGNLDEGEPSDANATRSPNAPALAQPQKWQRRYADKDLMIEAMEDGSWEVYGAGRRFPSMPGTSVRQAQQRADRLGGTPRGPWQRICRVCDEVMQRHHGKFVWSNGHEEEDGGVPPMLGINRPPRGRAR
jgi:hypothetical protein